MTSTTSHKRTKSHPTLPTTLTPSPLSLYLTTLRLLDSHTLPSAPPLTNTGFTIDSRSRLRATEFSLYHLFRLYSPSLTAEKLTPFFPPLEPLQSVNLRAALFRSLEGLRKDGVLGPGLVLRRSMLEECAGDRWWEVCCAFGGVVLGKVMRERRQGGIIQRIAGLRIEEKQVMGLALRVGLGRVVKERGNMRATYGGLNQLLGSKEEEMQVRGLAVRQRGRRPRDAKQEGRLRSLDENLTRSWIGDEDLKRVLLDGGGHTAEDDAFLQTTTDILTGNPTAQRKDQRTAMINLEQRTKAQSTRIQQWQKIHSKLQSSTEFEKPAQANTTVLVPNTLNFDGHRDLFPTATTHHASTTSRTGPHLATYDQLLTSMREELRRGRRAATAPEPQRRPKSITLDTLAGAPNLQPPSSSAVPFSPQRSPSGGFRPGMHGRVPSRTRTYQAPRVVSQKGLVPLKSEIFSPLKSDRPGSWDRSSRTVSVTMGSRKQSEDSGESGSIGEAAKVDSAVGGLTGSEELASPDELDETATDDSRDSLAPTPPPTVLLSLAERTRKSMAAVPSPSPPGQIPGLPPPLPHLDEPTDTLAARTLQTLSSHALPPPQQRSLKPNGHARTRSSINSASLHPQKVRRSSFTALQPPAELPHSNGHVEHEAEDVDAVGGLQVNGDAKAKGKRDITPREALFEATAEYDSVFRPRPKVKYSPPSSPTRVEVSSVGNED
nr:hypothetical protein B0A51_18972 [Rachicladosporium sp. CCFEE 5018]